MKIPAKLLIMTCLILPSLTFAISRAEYQKLQEGCAQIGKTAGIFPDGTWGCGNAAVASPHNNDLTPSLITSVDRELLKSAKKKLDRIEKKKFSK